MDPKDLKKMGGFRSRDDEAKDAAPPPATAPAADAADGEETWQLDAKTNAKPPADPSLAGLYEITHGTLYFGEHKQVHAGRRVRLSAEDAQMVVERGIGKRVGP